MKINKNLIEQVAKNARLNLTKKEVEEFLPQLKQVLETFSIVSKADTKNTEPSFHPIKLENVTRKDEVEDSLSREEALSNTKHKKDGYFKGPKVL
ncbi:MAG: Asp-tRNA(Asn)/Glu-tRNA(Gln) amidotransferase subunit GatC [archaeon]